MRKRNHRSSPAKHSKPSKAQATTPRRGDKMKLRRVQNDEELTSTDHVPLDLEPDGQPGTPSTAKHTRNADKRFATLANDDTDDEDDSVTVLTPPAILPPYSPLPSSDASDLVDESGSDSISVDTVELVQRLRKSTPNRNQTSAKSAPPIDDAPNADTLHGNENEDPPRPYLNRVCKHMTTEQDINIDETADTEIIDDDDDADADGTYDPSTEKGQRDFIYPSNEDPFTAHELERLLKDRDKDLQDVTKKLHFREPTEAEEIALHEPTSFDIPDESPEPHDKPLTPASPPRTYASVAAKDADQPYRPPTVDPRTSIRYGLRINIPATPQPLEVLLKSLKRTLKIVQDSTQGPVHIGAWDQRTTQSTLSKSSDIPNGLAGNKDKQFIQRYFDHWTKASPNKEYTAYMKIRFITSQPDKLVFPLDQIGINLSDDLMAECKDEKKDAKVSLSRNPLACQAIRPVVVGWLFGSVKSIRDDTFIPALKKELSIPPYVAIGVSWKVLRNEHKRQYKWDDGVKPPQALTIEIEESYYSMYAPRMSNLWKKRSKSKICGLQLRLIPCFSSLQMNSADDDLKTDSLAMAQKQQHFHEHYAVKLRLNYYIAGLDIPISDPLQLDNQWTLRRHLMKAAPKGLPSQRIFVSIDQAWNGIGHQFVTVQPHIDAAIDVMNHMIPECLHLYGAQASKWFNNQGLHDCKDMIWDPDRRRTISTDKNMSACVDEDFLGMGDKWKPKTPTVRDSNPITPAVLNPTAKATTAKEVIQQRMTQEKRSDQSVQSFGNRAYTRDHDGDTVQTTASALNNDSIDNSTIGNAHNTRVQINLTGMELDSTARTPRDDESVSTMAQTTGSTRVKLKSVSKHNAALTAENEHQAAELEELGREKALMEEQLSTLRKAMSEMNAVPPPKPSKRVSLCITPTNPGTQLPVTDGIPDSIPRAAVPGALLADTPAAGVGEPG